MSFSRRLSALFLTLVLSASHVGLCAGWMATPEARMACCSEDGACPMHKSATHDPHSPRAVTQAEADSCCAASEQNDSAPSAPTFVLSVSLAVIPSPVLLVAPATATQPDAWRRLLPVPGTHLPKHLLLSVLLV